MLDRLAGTPLRIQLRFIGARASRPVGRLLTGPLAFAAAGIADLLIYSLRSVASRVKQRQ